jgi:hypothetical protein
MLTRAAATALLVSLLSCSAYAGATSKSFMVGAYVVASATVSSKVGATTREGVQIHSRGGRGTPQPMVLAPASADQSSGALMVTVHY